MKRILLILALLILAIPASAQDELPDPGITPDNFFYPSDIFFDNIGVALTFGEEAKINKQFEIAEERLAEAQAMIQANKTEEAGEALENHNALMEQVRSRINSTNGANETLKLQLQIEERLRIHESKIVDVASGIDLEDQGIIAGTLNQVGLMEDEVQQGKTRSMSEIDNSDVIECELKEELGINCNGNVAGVANSESAENSQGGN